ncbi:unnamed protein product, partial [Mesorhabditis spiculigera]
MTEYRCSRTNNKYEANVQHHNVIANQLAQRIQLEHLQKVPLDGQRRVDTLNLPSSAVQRSQNSTSTGRRNPTDNCRANAKSVAATRLVASISVANPVKLAAHSSAGP